MPTIAEREPKSTEGIQAASPITQTCSIGSYLASRLEEIGFQHHFAVAGDYNLVLLDQLLLNKNIEQVYCCNELNCSFAAEGYARANGVAAWLESLQQQGRVKEISDRKNASGLSREAMLNRQTKR